MFASFVSYVTGAPLEEPIEEAESEEDEVVVNKAESEARNLLVDRLLQQFAILQEYERFQDVAPPGMYVVPSLESELTWHGAIFVHRGPYRGAIFKFEMQIPPEYPESGPRLEFFSQVFHPMVDPETGRVDLSSIFPEWREGQDYGSFALPHLYKAMHEPAYFTEWAEPPLNPKAKKLYAEDPKAFAEQAALCVASSLKEAYKNPTGSALQFSKSAAAAQDAILEKVRHMAGGRHVFEDQRARLVDWVCDSYARKRVQVEVNDAEVETITFSRAHTETDCSDADELVRPLRGGGSSDESDEASGDDR